LSPSELLEWASRVTGLTDFGPDDFSDGLAAITGSLEKEAGLTERGERTARAMLRGALVARLMSQAGFAALDSPAPVARPIIVTGLPRTGTTFLHRLLVADPRHQGLELWLAEAPQPRPPLSEWESNPAYQQIAAGLARHGHLGGVHEMGPGQVEECWQLLRQSMRSVSFESLLYVPSYGSWLAAQDWVPVYERHRRNLQLIGSNDADRRWVLKNPSHLFALDAIMTVYPDALIVVTHRSPVVAMASTCSLSAKATSGWSTVFTGATIGQTQLDLWARGLAAFTAARPAYDQAQFADVAYDDLVADPLGVVAGLYARFGLSLTDPARAAMAPLATSGGDSSHRYSLADYGLTETDVTSALA
jgi:LPS sulfotransferase NodH